MDDKIIHPNGKVIYFNEKKHRYYDDDGVNYNSVTSIIHDHFPKFDKEKIAAKCARKRGITKEEIIKEWDDTGIEACEYGTKVHLYAESILKGLKKPVPLNEKEERAFCLVEQFINEKLLDKVIIGIEKQIFCPINKIAGTIDLVIQTKDQKNIILDWKTNKEIKYNNYWENGLGRFKKMQNCNYNHYSLQLNIYRKILMEYYSKNETDMYLLHITENGIKPIKCGTLEIEAEFILKNGNINIQDGLF